MKLGEAVTAARGLLSDLQPPFRYSQETINFAVRRSLADVWLMRPDLFIGSYSQNQVAVTDAQLNNPAFELPVREPWVMALPYGIAAFCELRDNEYASDGRAAGLLALFKAGLT